MARLAPLPRMFLLPNPIKYIPQPRGMWPINPCFFNLNFIPLHLRGAFSFVASSLYRAYILASRMHAVAQRTAPPCVWQLSDGHRRGPQRLSVMRRPTTFPQNQENQEFQEIQKPQVNQGKQENQENHGNQEIQEIEKFHGNQENQENQNQESQESKENQEDQMNVMAGIDAVQGGQPQEQAVGTSLGPPTDESSPPVFCIHPVDDTKVQILLAARAARPLAALPTWDSLCLAAPLMCTRSFIEEVWTKDWENSSVAKKRDLLKGIFSLCDDLLAQALLERVGSPSLEDWDVCLAKVLKNGGENLEVKDFFRPLDVSHKRSERNHRKQPVSHKRREMNLQSPREKVKDVAPAPCRNFRAGTCNKGHGCRYSH